MEKVADGVPSCGGFGKVDLFNWEKVLTESRRGIGETHYKGSTST